MKNLVRKILLGDIEIKEYSTITINDEIKERIFLEIEKLVIDISKTHWLLCLEPIVFGIWIKKNEDSISFDKKTSCSMYFSDSESDNFKIAKRNAAAIIKIDYMDKIEEPNGTLFLLKLRESKIYHVNFLKTFLLFYKYYKKPKLSFEKYKSLVAAYSYPRRVRIISFKQKDYFNIFPMDLLGDISENNYYVFGLRHTNTTLSKIIETKKIVVSEVSYKCKDVIYQLGKHHGSSPPTIDSLPFKTMQSEKFGFYIPKWVFSYKEIEILKTIDLGSHMLLWGKVIHEKRIKEPAGNLYHLHFLQYYRQKLKGLDYPLV